MYLTQKQPLRDLMVLNYGIFPMQIATPPPCNMQKRRTVELGVFALTKLLITDCPFG